MASGAPSKPDPPYCQLREPPLGLSLPALFTFLPSFLPSVHGWFYFHNPFPATSRTKPFALLSFLLPRPVTGHGRSEAVGGAGQVCVRGEQGVLVQVVDDLLREGVLNDGEADAVKESGQKQEQARVLVDHARQKGPRASQAFIRSLCARDAFLAEALGLPDTPPPGRPEPQRGAEANAACVPESRTGMTLCPPDQCREIQAKEAGKIYPIGDRRSRTRLALIICNITFAHLNKREGAEVDLRGMTLLLEDLGYRVEIKINLTAKEMSTCLKDFAAREEHKTSDSTFLVLMSHGVRDGLCGVQSRDKDSDVLPIDDVFSIFNNNNCRALYEKPKVVIIQACRGTNKGVTYVSDSVVPVVPSADSASSSANYEEDAVRMVHLESDFICLYSTTLSKALSG
nr:PREDICTED: caspase-1 [Anolis carolinensis]|eukprot:XP_008122837.2 PREDICTED: caspase-1 [Anolis carolinensis]